VTFETHTCSAPAERADGMRDVVLPYVARDRAVTILDVGCGTGGLAFRVAEALPLAMVTGIDISPANIRAAESSRSRWPSADRVRFQVADYLSHESPAVDVIVSDTALHFMHGGPERLWTKLAHDLRPCGVLVCSMAYDSVRNRAISLARRLLRAMRCRPLDSAMLVAGRIMYGRTMDVDRLRERTAYMYIPAEQMMTTHVAETLAPALGLRRIAEHPVDVRSVTQLTQRTSVFVKQERAAS
jgi:trans-aconitate methyltransferase